VQNRLRGGFAKTALLGKARGLGGFKSLHNECVFMVKTAQLEPTPTQPQGKTSCVPSSVSTGTSVCKAKEARSKNRTRRGCTFLRWASLQRVVSKHSCHAPSTCLKAYPRRSYLHTHPPTHVHAQLTGFYSCLFPDAAGRRLPPTKSSPTTTCPVASPLPTHLQNHCRRIHQHRPRQQGLRRRCPENRVAHAGALV